MISLQNILCWQTLRFWNLHRHSLNLILESTKIKIYIYNILNSSLQLSVNILLINIYNISRTLSIMNKSIAFPTPSGPNKFSIICPFVSLKSSEGTVAGAWEDPVAVAVEGYGRWSTGGFCSCSSGGFWSWSMEGSCSCSWNWVGSGISGIL